MILSDFEIYNAILLRYKAKPDHRINKDRQAKIKDKLEEL